MLASVAIGILFGVISALITKYFKDFEGHPSHETALLFFISYLGYLVTLILNFSGVISILCTGIIMGHYTWYNLSKEGRLVSRAAFEIMGELLDSFVFVYVGFGTYTYVGQTVSYGFIGLMIVVVLLARLVVSVLFPMCLKLVWRQFKLKTKELITIWIGGSIRGAIAFALILSVNSSSIHNKILLKTTVLGIVLFTTIAFGSILPLFKQIFPILRNPHSGRSQIFQNSLAPLSFEMMSTNNDPGRSQNEPKTKLYAKWRNLDDTYLKRWLIKDADMGIPSTIDVRTMVSTGTQTKCGEDADWSVPIME
jgi:sodium/hydrogen exchanger-like protein 6/7